MQLRTRDLPSDLRRSRFSGVEKGVKNADIWQSEMRLCRSALCGAENSRDDDLRGPERPANPVRVGGCASASGVPSFEPCQPPTPPQRRADRRLPTPLRPPSRRAARGRRRLSRSRSRVRSLPEPSSAPRVDFRSRPSSLSATPTKLAVSRLSTGASDPDSRIQTSRLTPPFGATSREDRRTDPSLVEHN